MFSYKNLVLVVLLVNVTAFAQTTRVTIKVPMLYPEGTVYNKKAGVFYVSSVKTGTIGTVDAQGNYKEFYKDATLKATFGMKVDDKRNRLWVCASDPNKLYSFYSDSTTLKKMIRLVGIDLTSGKKVADIDLSNLYPGKHFGNDITLDDKGNIYMTDSYSPVIYKIDANDKASVFAQNDLFKAEDVGLNGIAWSKNGYLLAVNNGNGALLKIDINDPSKVTQVKLKQFLPGADGILFTGDNLVVSQNKGVNKAFLLATTNNWQSAEVKAGTALEDRFAQPSTLTMMNNDIYLLNSKLNELQDSTVPRSKEFSLQLVKLLPM